MSDTIYLVVWEGADWEMQYSAFKTFEDAESYVANLEDEWAVDDAQIVDVVLN